MRYILFGGPFYYASGGANDLIASGDDPAELMELAWRYRKGTRDELDWWHIYDTVEQEIVVGTQAQAHQAPDLPTRIAVRTPH